MKLYEHKNGLACEGNCSELCKWAAIIIIGLVQPYTAENSSAKGAILKMKMSRLESSQRVVLAFNQAFNLHDVVGMMRLVSDDCIVENYAPAPDGTTYSGKAAVTRFWKDFFYGSPQAHIEIEQILGFGFRCVMRWRYEWLDIAGNKRYLRGVDIYKVSDNVICEQYSYAKGSLQMV